MAFPKLIGAGSISFTSLTQFNNFPASIFAQWTKE